jgi:hypothetical protein
MVVKKQMKRYVTQFSLREMQIKVPIKKYHIPISMAKITQTNPISARDNVKKLQLSLAAGGNVKLHNPL